MQTTKEYLTQNRRRVLILLFILAILLSLAIIGVRLGASELDYMQIVLLIFSPNDSWQSTIIWDLRLPRILGAILGGAGLGMAGAVMQSILRNPLASPFTLGISNAAAFGAAFGIVILGGGSIVGKVESYSLISNPLIVTACAFFMALVATTLIIALIQFGACNSKNIILAGLAISAIFSTGLALLTFIADDVAIASIVFWQFGSLSKVTWDALFIIFVVVLFSSIFFFIKSFSYNALENGEDVALSLGVHVLRLKLATLIISALLTATIVSFFGIIGFIGLIAPHLAKRILGQDNRFVIIGSMACGAVVLLLAHLISSYAFSISLPVGIITSAIGGPMFLLILLRLSR